VYADPDITILRKMWLGRMKTHPHANLGVCGPLEPGKCELRCDRGGDRASRAIEGDEESVACGVDLAPAVRRERVAKKPTMVAADCGEDIVAHAPQQIGRPLDVAEEERHSAPRQGRGAHTPILASRPGPEEPDARPGKEEVLRVLSRARVVSDTVRRQAASVPNLQLLCVRRRDRHGGRGSQRLDWPSLVLGKRVNTTMGAHAGNRVSPVKRAAALHTRGEWAELGSTENSR
jgi:hypothetical protein